MFVRAKKCEVCHNLINHPEIHLSPSEPILSDTEAALTKDLTQWAKEFSTMRDTYAM